MTAITLDRETSNYWELIKSASNKAKLSLITLLSSSIADTEDMIITHQKPAKARRLNAMTDEQMEQEMQGEAIPISAETETTAQEIITANRGRIAKGLEKWL